MNYLHLLVCSFVRNEDIVYCCCVCARCPWAETVILCANNIPFHPEVERQSDFSDTNRLKMNEKERIRWRKALKREKRIHKRFALATGRKSKCLVTLFSCYIIRVWVCVQSFDRYRESAFILCYPRCHYTQCDVRPTDSGENRLEVSIILVCAVRHGERNKQFRGTEMSCTDCVSEMYDGNMRTYATPSWFLRMRVHSHTTNNTDKMGWNRCD